MASVDKFTDDAVTAMIEHNGRYRSSYSNEQIDPERTHLNYSIGAEHGKLTEFEYYKHLLGEKYLYGRGSQREKDAITAIGWVVTLPKEIYGNPEKEKKFFAAVHDFISQRYGNVISSHVHYDEGGLPHIHTLCIPCTQLDHDRVQFKTYKTKNFVITDTGRYEYEYKFKFDDAGQKIKLKNAAKMSEYYDEKVSANDVLNPIELKHFHPDLQAYLDAQGIEGKVSTGTTGGVNFSVKELKEFTERTGLTLTDIREMQHEENLLQSFVSKDGQIRELEKLIEVLQEHQITPEMLEEISSMKEGLQQRDSTIHDLSGALAEKHQELTLSAEKNQELQQQIATLESTLTTKQKELELAQEKIAALEREKELAQSKTESHTWGRSESWGTTSWGEQSGWENTKPKEKEEEKLW